MSQKLPNDRRCSFGNKKCYKIRLKLLVDVTFLTCQRKGNKNQRNDAVIALIIGTLLQKFECGCYCGYEKQLESKRKGHFDVTKLQESASR